jgi:hypothetical protein
MTAGDGHLAEGLSSDAVRREETGDDLGEES